MRGSPTRTVRSAGSTSLIDGAAFTISGTPPPLRFIATTCSSMICSGTSQPTARSLRPCAVTVQISSFEPQSAGTRTRKLNRCRRG